MKCFVIQPFDDGGEFDQRFDQVLKPAIEAAGLEAYRVDRDPNTSILIEDIELGIKESAACIADISEDNPNVWFELGLAIAGKKDVVLLSIDSRERFPFDVQHRAIVRYGTRSPKDFDSLGEAIGARLKAILDRQHNLQSISDLSPEVKRVEGLTPHEITTLVVVASNWLTRRTGVESWWIENEMADAGYNKMGALLGVTGLLEKGLIGLRRDEEGTEYGYLTGPGMEWLRNNQDRLDLRIPPDDDAPFS